MFKRPANIPPFLRVTRCDKGTADQVEDPPGNRDDDRRVSRRLVYTGLESQREDWYIEILVGRVLEAEDGEAAASS